MGRIMAIDDDIQILSVIKRALEKDGHQVTIRQSTSQVEPLLVQCDLLILDVMMPEEDGFSFCKKIRENVDCPIVFLTAKTMEMDMCEGFAAGGDDYVRKPFSIAELRSRVNAHLRREKREVHNQLRCGIFRFDLSEKILFVDEDELKLTRSEYELCEFLAKNKGQVFSQEQLIEQIFGYDSESDKSAIREHIKNIRSKMNKLTDHPIETVWGIGYKWKKEV